MAWLVLSYSLPSQSRSSNRVALWRRLKRIGCFPHKSGVYILPDREECSESFQWLCQEVQQAKGSATFMRVENFEGISDNQLIEMVRELRKEDYRGIEASIEDLEKIMSKKKAVEDTRAVKGKIEKLKKGLSEIHEIDFFHSSQGKDVQQRLRKLESILRARFLGIMRTFAHSKR